MATIKVRPGVFGKTLPEALRISRPGDRILLSPGQYAIEAFTAFDLTISGTGDPSEVVLETKIEVTGRTRLESLTLRAPHFTNALYMPHQGASAQLTRCIVHADPSEKYPALYCAGSSLSLTDCEVHGAVGAEIITLRTGSRLTASSSRLGTLFALASNVELDAVSAEAIIARERSRVQAGTLELAPAPGRRSVNLQGESVLRAAVLNAPTGPWEGYCEESSVEIGQAHLPEGEQYLMLTKGAGVVRSDSPAVISRDIDAPAPPKQVHWPLASARAFRRDILPEVNRGDTIILDEGDYFLDEFANSLDFRLHLRGAGSGRTFLHGCLTVSEDSEGSVSGLTLRARPTSNAVQAKPGSTLTIEDVLIEQAAGLEVPTVYLGKGSNTTFTEVRVQVVEEEKAHVDVDDARLEARRSGLGWLCAAHGSVVTLEDCEALLLQAGRGSQITGDVTLEPNSTGKRQAIASDGASIRMGRVHTEIESLEMASLGAELRIDELVTPPGASTSVVRERGGTAEVHGRSVEYLGEGAAPDPASSTTRPAAAPTRAPAPDAVDGQQEPQDGDAPEFQDAPGAARPAGASADGTEPAAQDDPLAEIKALTGLASVKEQIEGFTQMVRFNQIRARNGLRTSEMSMHSLFLGNPGTGKTTVARLLGKVLHQAGAISSDTFVEVGRKDLVSDRIGASAKKTVDVLESARGGVLFIDEAYSLHQEKNNEFAQEAVDALITYLEDHRDEVVVIFAGYADRMQDFLRMNPGLQSRVPNRFDFEDYTPAEIAEIGYRDLLEGDYVIDEGRYTRTVASLYARSADRSNGRWVRNLNESLVRQMVRRVMSAPDSTDEDLTHLRDEDLAAIGGGSSETKERTVEELLAQLDAMVGLEPVKAWVRSLVNRVSMDRQLLELDGSSQRPSYHMVFSGNPGTGKTTVADIIARLFHNLGVLAHPQVKVVERSSLVGSWIGHTEERTAAAVDEAMGGVLFVDEAYQLTVEGAPNDFGKLAVETLMTRLENDRDRFVAIFAGYTDRMEEFLAANPGLRSRIPLVLEFPDFTPQEVGRIVSMTLSSRWEFDAELVEQVAAETYEKLPEQDRSNGRWARNFAERLEALHSDHVATHGITGDAVRRIDPEVVRAAGVRG